MIAARTAMAQLTSIDMVIFSHCKAEWEGCQAISYPAADTSKEMLRGAEFVVKTLVKRGGICYNYFVVLCPFALAEGARLQLNAF